MNHDAFLSRLGPMAREDMQKTGVLASLTVAQAILESAWGSSGLTVYANNLFGIKGTYNGQGYICRTFEFVNGKRLECDAEFRKYPSWAESVADHSSLFLRLERYANLRGCRDYKQACWNVQADGYATAPTYAESLIALIEDYGLTEYDREESKMLGVLYIGDFTSRVEADSVASFTARGGHVCEVAPYNGKWGVLVTKLAEGKTTQQLKTALADWAGIYSCDPSVMK